MIDDVAVGGEHAARQPVLAQEIQMFSTGFNSGARAGGSASVRLSGTTRSLARCHPARSISMTPWAPGATACATSARCRLMACVSHRGSSRPRPYPVSGTVLRRCRPNSSADHAGRGAGAPSGPATRDLVLLADAGLVSTTARSGCRLGGFPGSSPRWRGDFFKKLQRLRVLGIVTRMRRGLAIAERAQLLRSLGYRCFGAPQSLFPEP